MRSNRDEPGISSRLMSHVAGGDACATKSVAEAYDDPMRLDTI